MANQKWLYFGFSGQGIHVERISFLGDCTMCSIHLKLYLTSYVKMICLYKLGVPSIWSGKNLRINLWLRISWFCLVCGGPHLVMLKKFPLLTGLYGMLGIESESAICKTNVPTARLLLKSHVILPWALEWTNCFPLLVLQKWPCKEKGLSGHSSLRSTEIAVIHNQ